MLQWRDYGSHTACGLLHNNFIKGEVNSQQDSALVVGLCFEGLLLVGSQIPVKEPKFRISVFQTNDDGYAAGCEATFLE